VLVNESVQTRFNPKGDTTVITIGIDGHGVQVACGQRIGVGNFELFVFPVGPREARSSSKHVRNLTCEAGLENNRKIITRANSAFF
jgi:hypothetical protein